MIYNSDSEVYWLADKVFYQGSPFEDGPWYTLNKLRDTPWSIFQDKNGVEIAEEVICLADQVIGEADE